MLGISLRDRIMNDEICTKCKVTYRPKNFMAQVAMDRAYCEENRRQKGQKLL